MQKEAEIQVPMEVSHSYALLKDEETEILCMYHELDEADKINIVSKIKSIIEAYTQVTKKIRPIQENTGYKEKSWRQKNNHQSNIRQIRISSGTVGDRMKRARLPPIRGTDKKAHGGKNRSRGESSKK